MLKIEAQIREFVSLVSQRSFSLYLLPFSYCLTDKLCHLVDHKIKKKVRIYDASWYSCITPGYFGRLSNV